MKTFKERVAEQAQDGFRGLIAHRYLKMATYGHEHSAYTILIYDYHTINVRTLSMMEVETWT